MSWRDLEIVRDGEPIHGTEGIMMLDQEHEQGARISLERDGRAPFCITCGIYDWMVHTRFFSDETEARTQFALMRDAVVVILERIPYTNDAEFDQKMDRIITDIAAFVDRFP